MDDKAKDLVDGAVTAAEALARWSDPGPLRPAPDPGLINRTWLVGEPPRAVLQWVNPIFDPLIHRDMAAATARLQAAGVPVPRLVPTADGELWVEGGGASWRLLTYLPGRTLHRLADAGQAAEAGALVGRFHAALAGWDYTFEAPRRDIHDTPARMAELEAALEGADGHPLAAPCRELGGEVLCSWAAWDGDLDLPRRPGHGDLKISNLRYDGEGRAIGLLDLDTLGPIRLDCEMGDAWRSWCNPVGEDDPERVRFDVDLFTAGARAWLAHAPPLAARERRALVPGIERICLELAARFAADAVENSYFREDRERFPAPGVHNLVRARGQMALALAARRARSVCEAVVASSPGRR